MKQIKAINTFYNGYHFRSRLEARWAVFFDALGVKYEYEPEGYVLPNGECYLPDFAIDGCDTCHDFLPRLFVEVKNGEFLSDQDAEKIREFSETKEVIKMKGNFFDKDFEFRNSVLVVGDIREVLKAFDGNPFCYFAKEKRLNGIPFYNFELIDGDNYPTFFGLDKYGNAGLAGPDYDSHRFTSEIHQALEIACKARFEHGQTPTAKSVRAQVELSIERKKWNSLCHQAFVCKKKMQELEKLIEE